MQDLSALTMNELLEMLESVSKELRVRTGATTATTLDDSGGTNPPPDGRPDKP